MHERQDLGEARGKSETEKARQNLESEVLVRLNGLSEMSGLRPRSCDGRKSRTVTPAAITGAQIHCIYFTFLGIFQYFLYKIDTFEYCSVF